MANVIGRVLDLHVEEIALLWLRRDRFVTEPHFTLEDIARLDERLAAHLDGLRLAEEAGWNACFRELAWGESGELFAPAILALQSDDQPRLQQLLAIANRSLEARRPVVSAIGWLPWDHVSSSVHWMLDQSDVGTRVIAMAGLGAHRRDPADALGSWITDKDFRVQSRAIELCGELGRVDLLPSIRPHLNSVDSKVQFWSAWTAAILAGDESSVELLRKHVADNGPFSHHALPLVVRRMPHDSVRAWLQQLAQLTHTVRPAITGAGIFGDVELVPWLLDLLRSPELARLAGEAIKMITGAPCDQYPLEGERPTGFQAGPTDDPNDDDVDVDVDENLPWPDADAVRTWWDNHASSFSPIARHLMGKPIDRSALLKVLQHGGQRQRNCAAFDLTIDHGCRSLFETRAPVWQQLDALTHIKQHS